MCRAIRELQKDTEIVILPADKGNAMVVMERSEYISKMNMMLEDKTYAKLKKDPTSKVERKINKALKTLEDKGYVTRRGSAFRLSARCCHRCMASPRFIRMAPLCVQLYQQLVHPPTVWPRS